MLGPIVFAGMKEWNQESGIGIDTGNVRAFMVIAEATGKCEVESLGWAIVLAGDDMLDVKSNVPSRSLREVAVLANIAGPFPNQFSQRCIHEPYPRN